MQRYLINTTIKYEANTNSSISIIFPDGRNTFLVLAQHKLFFLIYLCVPYILSRQGLTIFLLI